MRVNQNDVKVPLEAGGALLRHALLGRVPFLHGQPCRRCLPIPARGTRGGGQPFAQVLAQHGAEIRILVNDQDAHETMPPGEAPKFFVSPARSKAGGPVRFHQLYAPRQRAHS